MANAFIKYQQEEDITDERELKMVSEVLNQIDKENA